MKRCSQCKSLMPDDAARCIRCGWQATDTASVAPQPEEQQQAAAVGKRSGSSRMRTFAIVLASPLFFLASCNGIMLGGSAVTSMMENESKQIPIDEVTEPRPFVAVIATPVGAPASAEFVYWLVKEPERDLAEFRRRYPGYSFLPPSDKGHISDSLQETSVDYWVLKRESGKVLVKTHYDHYPMMITLDIRATYEATDSDIRLISYKVGSDMGLWPFLGCIFACLLGLLGEFLKHRIVKSELRAGHRNADLWAKALAEAKGNVPKAQSRYIAKRVKQLKHIGGASTETASSPPVAGFAPTSQTPIPNVRKRILLSTVAALVVNACAYAMAKSGHTTTAAEVIRVASVPLLCAVLVWVIVSLARGAKFRASWRVYEGTLLAVSALRLLGLAIYATTH